MLVARAGTDTTVALDDGSIVYDGYIFNYPTGTAIIAGVTGGAANGLTLAFNPYDLYSPLLGPTSCGR